MHNFSNKPQHHLIFGFGDLNCVI